MYSYRYMECNTGKLEDKTYELYLLQSPPVAALEGEKWGWCLCEGPMHSMPDIHVHMSDIQVWRNGCMTKLLAKT